jgi:hypothetical protein
MNSTIEDNRALITPQQMLRALLLIFGILLLAHGVLQTLRFALNQSSVFGLADLFDFDLEYNVPTQFSGMLFFLISALMFSTAFFVRNLLLHPFWWIAGGLASGFLGCDELMKFHEEISTPLRTALDLSGVLYFAWVIPYGIAAIVAGVIGLRLLRALPGATRNRFIVAGAVYLTGVLGVELLGGAYRSHIGKETVSALYVLITTLEESLEMVGLILLTNAILRHITDDLGGLCLQFLPNEQKQRIKPQ